jgi:hypothetical protein
MFIKKLDMVMRLRYLLFKIEEVDILDLGIATGEVLVVSLGLLQLQNVII